MKIMYIVYSFTVGGTEKLLVDICNEMIKKKHEVYIYIVNNYYVDEMLNLLDNKVHIELENRRIGNKNIIKTMFRISRFIKKNNIEIVHCNSLNSPELLFIAKLFNPKTKIFYTIHDMNQYKSLGKIRIIYRNIICNKIIAISNCVRQDIIRNKAIPQKVITIYNSIETNRFSEPNLKLINRNEPIIGNVSRIMPEKKGQDILINAIKELKIIYPKIKCYFAGGVATESQNSFLELEKQIKVNNLQDNVKFLGNVSDIYSFFKNIDIFVLPSRFEGFGLSLIEAMTMGIPVIASNIDGPAEIINREKCGKLFETSNTKDLSIKIKDTIENYEGEKGKALDHVNNIKRRYNICTMCNLLVKAYLEEESDRKSK